MATARGQIIDREVELFLSHGNTPQQRSERLAMFAREQLTEAQQINRRALGKVPDHDTFVDNRPGAALQSVRPGGEIRFEFELFAEMLVWVQSQLRRHSPRKSGRYMDSHQLYADGMPVDPRAVPETAEEFTFLSGLEYAKKIERGLSRQAPEGVYEVVALMASRRFGNVARIRFTYRSLAGQDRVPALVISPR